MSDNDTDDTTEGPLHDYRAADVEAGAITTERVDPHPRHPDADALPFRIGDPVMDAAQGRPMVVLDVPPQTVAEWSGDTGYDLTENYGNQKFGVHPNEPVVTCRYVSDVSGDPGKTYTFPQSRLRLIDVHHADGGRRVYDRVAVDVLRAVFVAAFKQDKHDGRDPSDGWTGYVHDAMAAANLPTDEKTHVVAKLARELADVDATIGGQE